MRQMLRDQWWYSNNHNQWNTYGNSKGKTTKLEWHIDDWETTQHGRLFLTASWGKGLRHQREVQVNQAVKWGDKDRNIFLILETEA